MSTERETTTKLAYDEVKSSIELLDQVLSEFDELDSLDAQLIVQQSSSSTEQDLSNESTQSLTDHQSEDDGYMSMNGRKPKFVLNFKPVSELHNDNNRIVELPPKASEAVAKFDDCKALPPPPVEEAEKIIAAILPEIPKGSSVVRQNGGEAIVANGPLHTAATQTTLPKTNRSTIWRNANSHHDNSAATGTAAAAALADRKSPVYGSLPYATNNHQASAMVNSPTKVPPRTIAGSLEKHREVNRSMLSPDDVTKYKAATAVAATADNDTEFSDDSLNEKVMEIYEKRTNIAWEVPIIEETDEKFAKKRNQLIGRSRTPNVEHMNGNGNENGNGDGDDEEIELWINDEKIKLSKNVLKNGFGNTYVIRRKKRQQPNEEMTCGDQQRTNSLNLVRLSNGTNGTGSGTGTSTSTGTGTTSTLSSSGSGSGSGSFKEFRKHSSTFDNLKSLAKNSEEPLVHLSNSCRNSNYNLSNNNSNHISEVGKPRQQSQPLQPLPPPLPPQPQPQPQPPSQQSMPKSFNLPISSCEDLSHCRREPLMTTVEEDEDFECEKRDVQISSPLRRIERNISVLLDRDNNYDPKKLIGTKEKFSNDFLIGRDLERKLNLSTSAARLFHTSAGGSGGGSGAGSIRNSASVQKSASQNDMEFCSTNSNAKRKTFAKKLSNSSSLQKSESAKEIVTASGLFMMSPSKNEDFYLAAGGGGGTGSAAAIVANGIYARKEFPPLPPSPVEEDDDEYSEIYPRKSFVKTKADTLPTDIGNNDMSNDRVSRMPYHRHQQQQQQYQHAPKSYQKSNSLNTKFEFGNYFQTRRAQTQNLSNRSMSSDRYPYPAADTTYLNQSKLLMNQKRASQASHKDSLSSLMQTSCSLPETPIFNRNTPPYCDIPRTPLKKPTVAESAAATANSTLRIGGAAMAAPRLSSTMTTLSSLNNHCAVNGYATGPLNYRRGNSINGLESVALNGELLRMTGGPARGWYPKHRSSTRPTSIEQLDRLSTTRHSRMPFWSASASPTANDKKPLTLPPNLTPKFFQRSPKEALRRVTSLLIKKGNSASSKDGKKEKSVNTLKKIDEAPPAKKKSFFRYFWKKNKNYTLDER